MVVVVVVVVVAAGVICLFPKKDEEREGGGRREEEGGGRGERRAGGEDGVDGRGVVAAKADLMKKIQKIRETINILIRWSRNNAGGGSTCGERVPTALVAC